jgi:hypothetical protein
MSNEAIKQIVESSDKIVTWSLTVLGGSVAILLGTSYIRPRSRLMRLSYLLFIPGWASLGLSFQSGNSIANRSIMFFLESNNSELVNKILYKINDDYREQLTYFYIGLFIFGVWLCTYLFWWIFSSFKVENEK